MTDWDPHTWPNKPIPTREILDRIRSLLGDVENELMRDEEPIAWAKSVCALGKLVDDQREQMMRHRVLYNLGKYQEERLMHFIALWDSIGSDRQST